MENILFKYMAERFNEPITKTENYQYNLPFITISREYGCPAKEISNLLLKEINNQNDKKSNQKWKLISKEILDEAAKELNVHPDRISKFYKAEKKSTIDEILISLTEKYYHSDLQIKKTLAKIIQDFAMKGNVIIVGRGGIYSTYQIPNGLHIRLIAPLDWRAERVKVINNCNSFQEALLLTNEFDKKRNELLRIMSNNKFNQSDFHLTYNCSYFSFEEITDSIIYHLSMKMKMNK